MSHDRRFGVTVIGFLGSVFSPYYARARRRGPADPLQHCAINVLLHGPQGSRWSMTERSARRLKRDRHTLSIGRSSFEQRDGTLTLHIDERGAPLPYALRGRIELKPRTTVLAPYTLDAAGAHQWWPLAPLADIRVEFSQPHCSWQGCGYLDSNWGSDPLEDAFESWSWSRSIETDRCEVHYDLKPRGAAPRSLRLQASEAGFSSDAAPAVMGRLPASRWAVSRPIRADRAAALCGVRTLQDAPFYCRSLVETRTGETRGLHMHESLSLDRFRKPWVQALLPFRMPRLP